LRTTADHPVEPVSRPPAVTRKQRQISQPDSKNWCKDWKRKHDWICKIFGNTDKRICYLDTTTHEILAPHINPLKPKLV
jgi:hypothetical protein